jgi:hypothetical protein
VDRLLSVVACITTLILSSKDLAAQRNSWRVTTPSPTAASLGKFGDVPVSLYSGVPDISIPLFTAKGRTLELPIVLEYHAGGIKVEEIGSWVGIGWALEAGGTITRTVHGLVDEDLGRGYFYTGNTWYNAGNWPDPISTTLVNLKNEQIDGEPDQFFFAFAGRSGQFVMGPTGASGPIEYRAIPHQKLKIEPVIFENRITQWTITTEDGTRYVFGQAETTTDKTTTSSTAESTHPDQTYTSSWHLTSITAPGGDVITLTYVQYTARHQMGSSREEFGNVQGTCVPPFFHVVPENEIVTARLASITTAVHTITFAPGADARTDDQPVSGLEPRLDKITVSTSGTPSTILRVFQFVQNYSTGRLTLASVAEQDPTGASLPPYTFTYDAMPLPSRFSFAMDHWGFYNGKHNNNTVIPIVVENGVQWPGADRRPDPTYMRAGTLKRITYPTGGYTEFDYEPNDYAGVSGVPFVPATDEPAPPATAAAGPAQEAVEQSFTVSSPNASDQILVTVSFSQSPDGCAGLDDPPCPMTQFVGFGGWQETGVRQFLVNPGQYLLRATTLTVNQQAEIEATWSNRVVSAGRIGAGLRVKEIRSSDGLNPENVTIRRYEYRLASDPTRSSGDISAEPKYSYTYSSQTCGYFSRSSTSKMSLGQGPVISYREVTVWHGANGEFGKTRHRFRSTADAPDTLTYANVWPFSRRTSHEWKRGQEVEAIELDASNRQQQRVAHRHTFQTDATTYRSYRGMSINSWSAGPSGATNFVYHPFEVVSGWAYQDGDTTITYDETGTASVSTARAFAYDNPAHLQLTQLTETNSDGRQRITRMKYPADYAAGSSNPEAAALTAMQGAAHIHNAIIERWVIDKTGGVERVVRAELTTFREAPTGRYLPYQRFLLNSPGPLP